MILPGGRLFWKLFIAFCLAVILSFICGMSWLALTGDGAPLGTVLRISVVPIVSGALVSIPIGLVFAWHLSHPLRHLSKALRAAASARFDVRVVPLLGSRRDELVDLAREFDSMAMRLQQAGTQRQQLFHDISHELRSPLARMQAAIGLLEQNPQEPGPMIERLQHETRRLDALVEELLTLHKLEAGGAESVRERVDLIELLTEIAQDAAFEAQTRGGSVTLEAQDSFVAEVDGELIYRAFENVVRNAVKYTAPDTTVAITTRILAAHGTDAVPALEVSVCDHGPGIPVEFRERIFEPFWRLEPQEYDPRSRATPGTGLGLAIARRALVLHGGTIAAIPRDNGLCVVSTVPAASPPHRRER